jgi:hypothetical protein
VVLFVPKILGVGYGSLRSVVLEQRMEPDGPADEPERPKVLAAGSPRGHRIELLEYPDGRIVITYDGVEHAVYRIGSINVESCIKCYLGVHRSCEGGANP